MTALASIAAALVIACNAWLVVDTIADRLPAGMVAAAVGLGAGALLLLAYLAFAPLRLRDDPSGVPICEFGRA